MLRAGSVGGSGLAGVRRFAVVLSGFWCAGGWRWRAAGSVAVAVAGVLVVAGAVMAGPGMASAGGGLTWKVRDVDGTVPINSVGCTTAGGISGYYCGAFDRDGNYVWSRFPAGAASGWNVTDIDGSTPFLASSSISKGTAAGDAAGNLLLNPGPRSNPASWSTGSAGPSPVVSVSCAGSTTPGSYLCGAVNATGGVVSSSAPFGAADAWHVHPADGTHAGYAISCVAGPDFCALADSAGNLLTSSNPVSGATWHKAPPAVTGVTGLASIQCLPGTGSGYPCVMSGYAGAGHPAILAATLSPGGAGTWTVTPVSSTAFVSISCPSAGFCAAAGKGGIWTSADPFAARPSWQKVSVGAAGAFTSISCPAASFCVAADSAGEVIAGTASG
jgi:hypothetical protein